MDEHFLYINRTQTFLCLSLCLSVFFFSRNQKKIQFAICDQGLNFLKKSESFLALW